MGDLAEQALRKLVGELSADLDRLGPLVAPIPPGSTHLAALPQDERSGYLRKMATSTLRSLAEKRPLSVEELDLARQLGADRAEQGVPLEALHEGMHVGTAVALSALVEYLRKAGSDPNALVDLVIELNELAIEQEHQATRAHRATELRLARTDRDQRNQLLRQLMLGEADLDLDELRRVGLDPAGRAHCLVTAEYGVQTAQRLEPRLAGRGGLFGLVNGMLCGVVASLPPAEVVGATLVVASPACAVAELPGTYGLCSAARDTGLRLGLQGLVQLGDLAADVTLDIARQAAPELDRLIAAPLLDALSTDDRFHRELVATALTYLDHDNRLDAAASALHVHSNTVKYRLRRLRELTGMSLEPPPGPGAVQYTLRWWWALRSWQYDNG
ncbi:PucR family transcriptional regulator [Nocardia sp. NPDC050175]|uniref:PucR family transcriptional regulator n=1 Tax=Nocardia sp. NPDC050175 TaxID=3364317 RepID=UPI0037B3B6E4